MKLGTTVGLRDDPDPDALAAQVRRLEDAGVEHLWTGEAYSADAVSTMGFLAAVSRTAQIGSSILPLYSRTPTLLAMTAVGIDKLSRGRCILGLGASGPQVIEGFHGVPDVIGWCIRALVSAIPSRSPKGRAPASASR